MKLYELRYRITRMGDNLCLWLASRAPRRMRYWITLDAIAKATTGKLSNVHVPDVRAMDVLEAI